MIMSHYLYDLTNFRGLGINTEIFLFVFGSNEDIQKPFWNYLTFSRRAQCTQYFISHALWMSTANQASHPTTKVISIVDFKTLACLELENMFDLKNKQTFCTGNKV